MNYLWGSMILIGIIYGTVTGHLEEVSEAAIQSSKEAVSLCVVMAGVTALWVGMLQRSPDFWRRWSRECSRC